jgi:hypothetical protein
MAETRSTQMQSVVHAELADKALLSPIEQCMSQYWLSESDEGVRIHRGLVTRMQDERKAS